MPDSEIERVLDLIEKSEAGKIVALLRALNLELQFPRDSANAIVFDPEARVEIKDKIEIQPRIFVYHRLKLNASRSTPILALDGTGSPWINRKIFGDNLEHVHIPIERTADVTGTIGKSYSKQSITGERNGTDADGRAIALHAADAAKLRGDIVKIVSAQPGKCFVAGTKKAIDKLIPELNPTDCITGHFGALRGINAFEKCKSAVALGREQPGIQDVENQARAWLADEPEAFTPAGNYVRQTRGRRMRDGGVLPIAVEVHPDPRVQEVLEQIREAEMIQAIDRVRAIFNERTIVAANDLVLDLTYDRVWRHAELTEGGSRHWRMIRQGVELTNASDMSQAFPDLWVTADAARKDVQRSGTLSQRNIYWGSVPLLDVSYQPTGMGQKPRPARFNPARIPDPRAWLESRLGPLARFDIETPAATAATSTPDSAEGRAMIADSATTDIAAPEPIAVVAEAEPPARASVFFGNPADWFPAVADIALDPGLSIDGRPILANRRPVLGGIPRGLPFRLAPTAEQVAERQARWDAGFQEAVAFEDRRLAWEAANLNHDDWPADKPAKVRTLTDDIPFAPVTGSGSAKVEPVVACGVGRSDGTSTAAAQSTSIAPPRLPVPDIKPDDISRVSWVGTIAFIGGVEVGRIGVCDMFVPRCKYSQDDDWWRMRYTAKEWDEWTATALGIKQPEAKEVS